jgi:hypothetical protein
MATFRPFAYNPVGNPLIFGTEQVGSIAAANGNAQIDNNEWWSGPDEEPGYVIAYIDPGGDRPNAPERIFMTNYICHVGFFRTGDKTDLSFVRLVRQISGNNNLVSGVQAKDWLTANGFWTSWPGALPTGMVLFLDAGYPNSLPGPSSSTWYDLSGNNNHGTINGATYTPENGGSLYFDGVNDYVDFASVNDIPIGNDPYTISAWFNSDEMPSDRGFVGWGNYGSVNQVNAWRLRNNGGNTSFRHYWWGNDLDYDTPTQLSTGVWYHGLVTFDGTTRSMWVNGEFVGSDLPGLGHNVPYATNLTVGVTNNTEWFWGKLAQIIIYKRGVSAQEVEMIYSSGKNRFGYNDVISSGLVVSLDAGITASYPGTGNLWEDLTGNNNDATLVNTPTYNSGFGGHLIFDDTQSEYATIPDIGDLNEWTVEVWFRLNTSLTGKISSIVTNQFDLSSKLNFTIGTNNQPTNANLAVGFFDGSWRSTTGFVPNTGQWYQVVGTYDGTTLRQYVDGTASGGTLTYSGTPQSGGEIRIMRRWDSALQASNLIDGDLQIVRIYNRALSSSEVTHNYNMNVARFS